MKIPTVIQGFEGQAPLEFLETVSRALGDTTEGVESSEEEEDEVNHDELGDLESLVDHLLDQDQQGLMPTTEGAQNPRVTSTSAEQRAPTFGGLMRRVGQSSSVRGSSGLQRQKMSKKAKRMAAAGRQNTFDFADEHVTRGTRGWGRRAVRRRENLRVLAASNRAASEHNGTAPTASTDGGAAPTDGAADAAAVAAAPGTTERELSGATRSYFRQVFDSPGALELWAEFSEATDASQRRFLWKDERPLPDRGQGEGPHARYSALDRNTRQLLRSVQASGKVLLAEIEMMMVNGIGPFPDDCCVVGSDQRAVTVPAAAPAPVSTGEWVALAQDDAGDGREVPGLNGREVPGLTGREVPGLNGKGDCTESAERTAATTPATPAATAAAATHVDIRTGVDSPAAGGPGTGAEPRLAPRREVELTLVDKYDRKLAHAIAKFHNLESFSETTPRGVRITKVVAPEGSMFGARGTVALLSDYLEAQ